MDVLAKQIVGSQQQSLGRRNGTNDKMRMLEFRMKELARGFQHGMAGLNRNLRGREIGAHENVDVINLSESRFHGVSPYGIVGGVLVESKGEFGR